MLQKPRNSLPIDITLTPLKSFRVTRKRASVDIHNNELMGNRKLRLEKLDSIIKSTKQYNSSLQNLRKNWSRTSSSDSLKILIPSKQ